MSAIDPLSLQPFAERVFGAAAEAAGLKPARDWQQAAQQLAAAQAEECQALARYGAVAGWAWLAGLNRFVARLPSDPAAAGVTPRTMLRAWVEDLDAAGHAAMLSPQGLAATADTVRAASRRRDGVRRLAALGAQALGQPTRQEMDEAFREIQLLKRERRRAQRGAVAGARHA